MCAVGQLKSRESEREAGVMKTDAQYVRAADCWRRGSIARAKTARGERPYLGNCLFVIRPLTLLLSFSIVLQQLFTSLQDFFWVLVVKCVFGSLKASCFII